MASIGDLTKEINLYDIYIRQIAQTIATLEIVRGQIQDINIYVREIQHAKQILDRNIYSLQQEQQRLVYLKLAQITHKNILSANIPALEYRP